MPGNSTTRPQEKAALQRGSMSPECFEDALELSCNFLTLDDLMAQLAIEHIDLLKVPCRGPFILATAYYNRGIKLNAQGPIQIVLGPLGGCFQAP